MPRKHPHYFRSVAHLSEIDIYRLLDLFGVTDQALGHAIKKLVVPGMRGGGKVCQITPWPPTQPDHVVIPPPPEYDPASVAFAGAVVDPHGWIKWDSGECPVPPGTRVRVRNSENIEFYTNDPEGLIWGARLSAPTITAYRVVRT